MTFLKNLQLRKLMGMRGIRTDDLEDSVSGRSLALDLNSKDAEQQDLNCRTRSVPGGIPQDTSAHPE